MIETSEQAPDFALQGLDGSSWRLAGQKGNRPALLVFFETDCPTCQLTLPYVNRLAKILGDRAVIAGISQDSLEATAALIQTLAIDFPVLLDRDLAVSRAYDPAAVPALLLLDRDGKILRGQTGFAKDDLNRIASEISRLAGETPVVLAEPHDGAPASKPGCSSRHRESALDAKGAPPLDLYSKRGRRAGRIELADDLDPYDYCLEAGFADPLPVVPPTVQRVERMLAATSAAPDEIIGRIPPNYGAATVEKIAANAVMAGCRPEMMRVLLALIRAACDERFNLHGLQATTHFAAPLIIVNGPVRGELGFACGSNVFSNVARANSTLGRAFQLILANLGGARPGEIDMSTQGNPGKFSYCIAENEEASPWNPLHVELGFEPADSALTLFGAEPPRAVSEHTARDPEVLLMAAAQALATVWSYRLCGRHEAFVALCPEHAQTLSRWPKQEVRRFLFENTGIPIARYRDDGGEGTQFRDTYEQILIDGEPCYRKFSKLESIRIVVAGGDAGKFSSVIGSWSAGPRGSQTVTYPIA